MKIQEASGDRSSNMEDGARPRLRWRSRDAGGVKEGLKTRIEMSKMNTWKKKTEKNKHSFKREKETPNSL